MTREAQATYKNETKRKVSKAAKKAVRDKNHLTIIFTDKHMQEAQECIDAGLSRIHFFYGKRAWWNLEAWQELQINMRRFERQYRGMAEREDGTFEEFLKESGYYLEARGVSYAHLDWNGMPNWKKIACATQVWQSVVVGGVLQITDIAPKYATRFNNPRVFKTIPTLLRAEQKVFLGAELLSAETYQSTQNPELQMFTRYYRARRM